MGEGLRVGIGGLVFLCLYLASVIVIGWYAKKREVSGSIDDYFLANRAVGAFLLFCTLYSAQYSGNTALGYPGQAYRVGYIWLQSVPFMISVIVAYLLYAPRLRVLSKEHKYVTPTDYLYDRYGSAAVCFVGAILMVWGLINMLFEQLVATGHLFAGISGGLVPYAGGILFMAAAMVLLLHFGGFRGVVWSDVLQSMTFMVGLFVALGLILSRFGGLSVAAARLAATRPALLQVPKPQDLAAWYSTMLLIGIGAAVYPHAIQRIYAARSEASLKRAYAAMAFMPFFTTFLVFLIGIIGAGFVPGLEKIKADQIFPIILGGIMNESFLGYVAGLVVLAAVAATIMDTADAVLLSLSSIVAKDIYARIKTKVSEEAVVSFGKAMNWVMLAVCVLIAWRPLTTLWRFTELKFEFLIQVAPAFMVGLYWKRVTAGPVLAGMVAGTLVAATLTLTGHAKWLGLHSGIWGLLVNLTIVALGSLIAPPGPDEARRIEERFIAPFTSRQ